MPRAPDLARACAALLLACGAGLALRAGEARAQSDLGIQVESRKEADGHRLVARNTGRVPVEVTFSLAEGSNVAATRSFPFSIVLQPGELQEATRVYPANRGQGYRFAFRYAQRLGDPNARPDPGARYRLPFGDGLAFMVSQAPGGPIITHGDVASANAIDIVMPEGTPILAARGGMVIEIHQKSETRGDVANRGNYVRIFHDDGTWADYAHLSAIAPDLALHERVEEGRRLGASGNTGQSSGPHLHFHVQHNNRGRIESIPVRFHTRKRGVVTPVYRGMLVAD